MAYVAYCKALYDYAAQAADELTLTEDNVLYILENDDAEWWKAKLKSDSDGGEEQVGLVPANYVEEAPPLRLSRALYDYAATSEEELSIAEDELLRVYESDGPWLLVQKHAGEGLDQGTGRLGFVPANYVDEVEAVDAQEQAGIVPDPEEAIEDAQEEAAITAAAAAASTAAVVATPAAATASSSIPADKADDIRMWSVQILDAKKKKKKGTLGLGNASLFFASESDKAPVQRINVLHITTHTLEKGKTLTVELSDDAGAEDNKLTFQISSSKDAEEIVDKLETSMLIARANSAKTKAEPKARSVPPAAKAGGFLPPPPPPAATTSVTPAVATANTSATAFPPPARKTVSFSAPAQAQAAGEPAIALYDFTAEGDDELSVTENEEVVILERENEDWWKVRNKAGQEGVVPASYVEAKSADEAAGVNGQDDDDGEDEAAAAEEAERAERERRQARLAEQRQQEIAARKKRDDAERQRRQALKAQPAPVAPSAESRARNADSARAAAKDVQIPKNRSQPDRPKDAAGGGGSSRSRPDPYKTRIWQDVSGKFSVEAQFLQLTQGKVRLHKINGVVIDVPVEKMSKPDIQYLEEVTGKRLFPSRSNGSSSRRGGGGGEETSLAQAAEQRRRDNAQRDSDQRRQMEREQRYREREREKQRQSGRGDGGAGGSSQNGSRNMRKNVDWFEFFLAAGVDVDDCTRYAAAFERDKIDESLLPDMEASVLRSLGLREGDIIRVTKHIEKKYGPKAAPASSSSSSKRNGGSERQIKDDEELARKLQEQETAARRGATTSPPPPNLFSSADGSLKTNRRGRPNTTPKTTSVVGSIDASALSSTRDAASTPPSRIQTSSPEMIQNMKRDAALAASRGVSGFDDDAWTPRPPSTKPATPAAAAKASKPAAAATAAPPAAPTPSPAVAPPAAAAPAAAAAAPAAAPSPAPSAPAATPSPAPDPNSALFEKLAAMRPPSASTSSPGPSMGFGYNPNTARGPLAPVPANQGLLQPLVPTGGTGAFVPTRGGPGGLAPMMTGMGMGMMQQQQQPQLTGWQGNGSGLMAQPTGYGGMGMGMGMGGIGMGMGMGGMGVSSPGSGFSNPGMLAPMTTGVPYGGLQAPVQMQQQQLQQPQQQQQQQPQQTQNGSAADKFSAANVFAQMKTGQFGADANKEPQSASRYDALRPQPTGFQPGGILSQPTGFPQQQPQQQQPQFGMGMQPMGMQMTGFPGQQQQQQQPYPGFGQGGGSFGFQRY